MLEVRRWYEARRAELGGEFLTEIERLVDRIATSPLADVDGDVVRRLAPRCAIRPIADVVVILAIQAGRIRHAGRVVDRIAALITVRLKPDSTSARKLYCGR